MRRYIAAAMLALAPVSVVAVEVPAHAATSHVTHDLRDTNWPCAGC